jgi:hypothetical protein
LSPSRAHRVPSISTGGVAVFFVLKEPHQLDLRSAESKCFKTLRSNPVSRKSAVSSKSEPQLLESSNSRHKFGQWT